MLKLFLSKFVILFVGIFCQLVQAGSGLLFNVTASGTPATYNITICLNADGPLSCQNADVTALNLSILTTIPNHTYPNAGIKINTPGYTLQSSCLKNSLGFCTFQLSNTVPVHVSVTSTEAYSIGGPISGLTASGLVLQNNGGDNLTVPANATSFVFSTPLTSGETYHITILSEPVGQNCLIQNGTGIVSNHPVTSIDITCHVNTNEMASGRYISNGLYYPFIMNLTNNQISYPISVNTLPAGTKGESGSTCLNVPQGFCEAFFTTNCTITTCLAAGSQATDITIYPFLAQGENQNWAYEITSASTLPTEFTAGFFLASSCTDTTCIAGGGYEANITMNNVVPLLTQSDAHSFWSYVIDATHQAVPDIDQVTFGAFNSNQCLNNYCIAAGYYEAANYGSLILAQSNDMGIHWTYPIYANSSELPPDYLKHNQNKRSGFNSASCVGNHCIAAGLYFAGSGNTGLYYPVLAESTISNSNTWSYPIYSTQNQPANSMGDTIHNTGFLSSSCMGTLCLAGGRYFNGTGYYPFIAQNQNGSWTYVIDLGHPIPSTSIAPSPPNSAPTALEIINVGFKSISCATSLFCVAVGQYYANTNYYPLLAVTKDGGNHWTYPYIPPSDMSPNLQNNAGTFFFTNCKDSTCIAGGNYSDGTYYYPLLAITYDAGVTWTNVIDSDPATLPSDAGHDSDGLSGFLSGSIEPNG